MKESAAATGKALKGLLSSPYVVVSGLAVAGAACVVSGVALLAGGGWALIAAGGFSISAAGYITKGLKPNG